MSYIHICTYISHDLSLQDMALLAARVAFTVILSCLSQLSSGAVEVRRVNEKLTLVPQNITTSVTKLILHDNLIKILHNDSFYLYEKMTYISLNRNPVWKINNGTFDNNPLLKTMHCVRCVLRVLPSSFGPAMGKIENLHWANSLSDTSIITSPYFESFSSLIHLDLSYNPLYDADNINFPPSIQSLDLTRIRISQFPNISLLRFSYLKTLRLSQNYITNISNAALAGANTMFKALILDSNRLVQIGDFTILTGLEYTYMRGNKLETIPDMLGLTKTWGIFISGNTRLTCDHRMCWMRLWNRMRSRLSPENVQCMAPSDVKGHLFSLISPGFMQCDQGEH